MIELSDFLGNILSQISEARKQADKASIALAEYYAQDKLMRCLPVPRVRLPNIELTIPVAIKEVAQKPVYDPRPGLPKKDIIRTMFRTMYEEENKQPSKRARRFPHGFIGINKAFIRNTNRLGKQLRKSGELDDRILEVYIDDCINKFISIKKLSKENAFKDKMQLKERLYKELVQRIPTRQDKLSNIGFTAQSNEIKELEVAGHQPILMKLFVKEDAFELVKKNDEGEEDPVKDKDLDNYYLTLE